MRKGKSKRSNSNNGKRLCQLNPKASSKRKAPHALNIQDTSPGVVNISSLYTQRMIMKSSSRKSDVVGIQGDMKERLGRRPPHTTPGTQKRLRLKPKRKEG